MNPNPYTLVLNSLYVEKVLDTDYLNHLIELSSSYYYSPGLMNKELRTFTLNLGRRSGATTAIEDFISSNPELNFIYISVAEHLQRSPINTKNVLKVSTLDTLKYLDFGNVDVVFFDNYSFLQSSPKLKGADDYIYERLNGRSLKKPSQIYIRLS